MHDLWTSAIAGAYSALCLTMWGTAVVYIYKVAKNYSKLGLSTAFLMVGIAVTFLGHAIDQTLWTASNVDRALQGGANLKLSAWYAKHIPLVIVAGKFFASMGAFFHLWVAFHPERGGCQSCHRLLPCVVHRCRCNCFCDLLMEILISLVEKAPYAAFSGYLIWVIVNQSKTVVGALCANADSQKELAEAVKTLRNVEDSNRELALKISELRADIARLA